MLVLIPPPFFQRVRLKAGSASGLECFDSPPFSSVLDFVD